MLSMTVYLSKTSNNNLGGIVAYKSMLPSLYVYQRMVWSDVRYMNTEGACWRIHAHMSRCTCLRAYLKPSFLSRKMLIVWMLEQTVFTPSPLRPQVIGPYAAFLRNLICCQRTSAPWSLGLLFQLFFYQTVALRCAYNRGMECVLGWGSLIKSC